jgi:hypothetical protein
LNEYYTTTGTLLPGSNYKFKATSKTSFGYSLDSEEIVVMAASVPDVPTLVASTIENANADLTWSAPYNGGTPITAYTIQIRNSDGVTYSQDLANCDGTDSTIVADAMCSVPTAVLLASPFNLEYGDDVYYKVLATNVIGSSLYSAVGNSGTLFTVPGAPLSFASNSAGST